LSNRASSLLLLRTILPAFILAFCAFPAPAAAQMLFSRADQVSAMLDKVETAMSNAAAASDTGVAPARLGQAPVRVVGEKDIPATPVNAPANPDAARQFSGDRGSRMDETMKDFEIELTFKYLITGG
jgi:hypothetical protein